MGKKNRRRPNRVKGQALTKTREDRLKAINDIKGKLEGQLGLTPMVDEATRQLFIIMDTFVENGEAINGKIEDVVVGSGGINRRIHYILTNSKNKDCKVNLLVC